MPTITEVAALAGVSATTVSHALSGRRPVSRSTRERVEAAIAELGYRPNEVARSLRTQRTNTVAVIIPDITNPYYPAMARGLHDVLGPEGFFSVVCSTDADRETELGFVTTMLDRSVDALVLHSFGAGREDLLPLLAGRGVPVVAGEVDLFGVPDVVVDRVAVDETAGAAEVTRHVVERGARRVAFVAGPAGIGPGDRRLGGFRSAMAAAGLTVHPEDVVRGAYTVEGGRSAGAELLDRGTPDAVVCANDLMAIGVLQIAAGRGLRVPHDVAVTGFDDIDAASMLTPALTTVLNPAYESGRTAGRLLLDRLQGRWSAANRVVPLSTRLIVRQTT